MPENDLNMLKPKVEPPVPTSVFKRILFFLVGVLVLVGIAWGIGQLSGGETDSTGRTLSPWHQGFLYRVKNFLFHPDQVMEGQPDDRINILLLGVGGVGHDGPFLSDTNIIISIKPSTKEIALISVPRDTGVDVTGHGWRKINSADAFGEAANPGQGGDFARQVFGSAFGISIPYYIRVDFTAFEQIVDSLGGVNINVPKTFSDSQFPGENFSFRTVHFDAGIQTMTGEQALTFARSRHGDNGEGSDFARSRRQQLLLTALREKVLSAGTLLNPGRMQSIFDALTTHVATNLTFEQLLYMGNLARDLQLPPKTVVLDSSPTGFLINTTGEDGAFILSPKSGNFTDINNAIANVFSTTNTVAIAATTPTAPSTTYITVPNANTTGTKVEVQNGTWRAGLAAKIGDRLNSKGYIIIRVGNSLMRPIDKTTIYVLNNKMPVATLKALSDEIHAPYVTVLPTWLSTEYDNTSTSENEQGMKYNTNADLLIILGTDTKD